jgi:glycosyltransferase involved in cell wall biosynthesis
VVGGAKARALADADLFVLPSYQENFGIAAAEAMAAGLPVVVSDRVGIAEQVAEAGAGTVVPCDAAAVADAIRRAALDPEARLRAGERAARLARGRFAWEHTSRRLLELYRELGAPGGRGG